MTGHELFEVIAHELEGRDGVSRSTMMGLACLRQDGRFFASCDRDGALVVKLDAERVAALVAGGPGVPFAPAGRTFREWVAVPAVDVSVWRDLVDEARALAARE